MAKLYPKQANFEKHSRRQTVSMHSALRGLGSHPTNTVTLTVLHYARRSSTVHRPRLRHEILIFCKVGQSLGYKCGVGCVSRLVTHVVWGA